MLKYWAAGKTVAADIYDFDARTSTPPDSPVLSFEFDPPAQYSNSASPEPEKTPEETNLHKLPRNVLLTAIFDLQAKVKVQNERTLAVELSMSCLERQNERLIQLVQSLIDKQSASPSNPTFTPHRPWDNLTATPTREQPSCSQYFISAINTCLNNY